MADAPPLCHGRATLRADDQRPDARHRCATGRRPSGGEAALASDMSERLTNRQSAQADELKALIASSDEQRPRAGRMLIEMKQACADGQWLPFLERAGWDGFRLSQAGSSPSTRCRSRSSDTRFPEARQWRR